MGKDGCTLLCSKEDTRPFGGAGVLRGYSAAVLDELAATDDEGLGGDVGEAELEQECARGARSRRKSRAR